MEDKFGSHLGIAMIAYAIMSGYMDAAPDEQDEILNDAIEFAEGYDCHKL